MNPIEIFPKPTIGCEVSYHEPIILLGSCFSTHIADELTQHGFQVNNNPLGTIFHPTPLARFLKETLSELKTERIIQRNDVFLSWDASSSVYAFSEIELKSKIATIRASFLKDISRAKLLVITLGSAHGYTLKSSGEIVANCHKTSSIEFDKKCTESVKMYTDWAKVITQLKVLNPDLKVVFTLSPVRYRRDGWVENNQSKAELLTLVHRLVDEKLAYYFPSYEWVIDVLRDYRYFEKDGVHPNELAVEGVWKLFQNWFFSQETQVIVDEVNQLNGLSNHRLLFPESLESESFLKMLDDKRNRFKEKYPFVNC